MKRVKAHGRKVWNCGWRHRDRATLNRGIERSFRQTAHAEIDEQLADMTDPGDPPPKVMSREEILAELAYYDDFIDCHGSLCGSDEDEQAELFEALAATP